MWWPEVELNHRHTDFQSVALPTELSGPFKEGLCGITEFSSVALRMGRSGAVGETRTPTHFHAHEPESCVSTNSTTTALKLLEFYNMILIPFLNHPKNIRIKNSLFKPLLPIFTHTFTHTSEVRFSRKYT